MRKIYWWTKQLKQLDLEPLEIIKLFLNEYGESALINNEGFLQSIAKNMYSFVLENQTSEDFLYLIKYYCNTRLTTLEIKRIYDHTIEEFKRKYNIDYD